MFRNGVSYLVAYPRGRLEELSRAVPTQSVLRGRVLTLMHKEGISNEGFTYKRLELLELSKHVKHQSATCACDASLRYA